MTITKTERNGEYLKVTQEGQFSEFSLEQFNENDNGSKNVLFMHGQSGIEVEQTGDDTVKITFTGSWEGAEFLDFLRSVVFANKK